MPHIMGLIMTLNQSMMISDYQKIVVLFFAKTWLDIKHEPILQNMYWALLTEIVTQLTLILSRFLELSYKILEE